MTLSAGAQSTSVTQPDPLAGARRAMAEKHFASAEAELRAYLAGHGDSGAARYLLAYTLLRQGRARESLGEYTRAAELTKPSAEQLKDVGQAYVLLDDYADAARWTTRALEMDRHDPEIWYSLGRVRFSEQQYAEAEQCFRQALLLAPQSAKAENNLGLALEGLNRPAEAEAAYRRAIALEPAGAQEIGTAQPLLNLAILLMRRAEPSEARMLLLRAVTIAPEDPRIREELGHLALESGEYPEARDQLLLAVRTDPQRSNLHFLLGQAYRHLGLQREAKEQFAEAARLAGAGPGVPVP